MTKSARIRELELKVVRLEMNLEIITSMLQHLLDQNNSNVDLDAGKWYLNKSEK